MNTANNDIAFSDEQAMILESARDFCRSKSTVAAIRSLLDSSTGFDETVWRELCALGWTGIAIDERFGGSAMGPGSLIPVAEMMGRYLLSTPFFSTALAAEAIQRGASNAQKARWLPRLAEGAIGTLALLENEDWGSDDWQLTATPGNEGLSLQGRKTLVHDAAVAELFVVTASLEGSTALIVVESSQLPEGALTEHTLIDETKRAATIDFEGTTVAADQVLGGDAGAVLRDIALLGALLVAAEATGSAAACLDTTVEYLKTRKQFGKLIGSYQALKHPAVDILCAVDSAKSLVYHAATLINGQPLSRDAEIACRMAKVQASEALSYAGDRAVQFHGGMGFTYECDAQLYIRRAQWSRQQFGDERHHRKRLGPLLLD